MFPNRPLVHLEEDSHFLPTNISKKTVSKSYKLDNSWKDYYKKIIKTVSKHIAKWKMHIMPRAKHTIYKFRK